MREKKMDKNNVLLSAIPKLGGVGHMLKIVFNHKILNTFLRYETILMVILSKFVYFIQKKSSDGLKKTPFISK